MTLVFESTRNSNGIIHCKLASKLLKGEALNRAFNLILNGGNAKIGTNSGHPRDSPSCRPEEEVTDVSQKQDAEATSTEWCTHRTDSAKLWYNVSRRCKDERAWSSSAQCFERTLRRVHWRIQLWRERDWSQNLSKEGINSLSSFLRRKRIPYAEHGIEENYVFTSLHLSSYWEEHRGRSKWHWSMSPYLTS